MDSPAPLLSLKSISKRFPGVQALANISLTLAAGENLAIVGENGAGKSTLLKILGGVLRPDAGQVSIDGVPRDIHSVRAALALGIRLIHQELNQAPHLSVAENICLGRQPRRGPTWFPLTNRRQMHEIAEQALARLGVRIALQTPISRVDLAHRQLVEIAKALSTQGRLFIFDEPTSSLSATEANRLLGLIEQLRDQGAAILYVSHRLEEVIRVADHAMVLRDGRHVATLRRGEFSHQQLACLMVGRNLERGKLEPSAATSPRPPALDVRELRFPRARRPISFQIAEGEIVGVAGIVGAGRSELARAVFGIDRRLGGEVLVGGRQVPANSPRAAVRAGLALAPDDRRALGLFTEMSVVENIGMVVRASQGRRRYDRRGEALLAAWYQRNLNIRTPSLAQCASRLSGGNQQKIVLAKWLATNPRVLILDEPTRGVDLGARQEIYRLIREVAAAGRAVMMISNELEEIIELAHRVIVMRGGEIVGELPSSAVTEAAIMALAVGIEPFDR